MGHVSDRERKVFDLSESSHWTLVQTQWKHCPAQLHFQHSPAILQQQVWPELKNAIDPDWKMNKKVYRSVVKKLL